MQHDRWHLPSRNEFHSCFIFDTQLGHLQCLSGDKIHNNVFLARQAQDVNVYVLLATLGEVVRSLNGQRVSKPFHSLPLNLFISSNPTVTLTWQMIRSFVIDVATDGSWSCWGAWSSCSGGKMTRSRQCNNPAPSSAGLPCIGLEQDSSECF